MFPLTPSLSPRGEGRPFIPPAELGGILAYFDKTPVLSDGLKLHFLDNGGDNLSSGSTDQII